MSPACAMTLRGEGAVDCVPEVRNRVGGVIGTAARDSRRLAGSPGPAARHARGDRQPAGWSRRLRCCSGRLTVR